MALRIGIMGGVFDPVHSGHLKVAESAFREVGLNRVFLVITESPPHKSRKDFAPVEMREKMLSLAIDGIDFLAISDLETRTGGVTYTIDTLREFHRRYAEAELYLIIGGDSLAQLTHWREWPSILALSRVVVARRSAPEEELGEDLEAWKEKIMFLTSHPFVDLASSAIRGAICEGRKPEGVHPKVYDYIVANGLYGCDQHSKRCLPK
jgi:nicotinate-nucleotide adenylyltransferase